MVIRSPNYGKSLKMKVYFLKGSLTPTEGHWMCFMSKWSKSSIHPNVSVVSLLPVSLCVCTLCCKEYLRIKNMSSRGYGTGFGVHTTFPLPFFFFPPLLSSLSLTSIPSLSLPNYITLLPLPLFPLFSLMDQEFQKSFWKALTTAANFYLQSICAL